MYANYVKQQPGRARQNSYARAGRNFSQPRTIFIADLCTRYKIRYASMKYDGIIFILGERNVNLPGTEHDKFSKLSHTTMVNNGGRMMGGEKSTRSGELLRI